MEKILITGAGGLIGSHLLPHLLLSHEVVALNHNNLKFKHSNLSNIPCDFSKEWETNILPPQVDTIIHLAQAENFRDFPAKAESIFSVNTLSTLKLLEYARKAGVKKFIYASSGGIYGMKESGITEDSPVSLRNDLSFYLNTKMCSEILIENYISLLNIIVLRFFFVYGKAQNKTMLIPRLVESVKNGIPIILLGETGIKINPIHASDAAHAIVRTMQLQESQKINIAGNEILSIRTISEIIEKELKIKPVFEFRKEDSSNCIADISKMSKIPFLPEIKFEVGIREML